MTLLQTAKFMDTCEIEGIAIPALTDLLQGKGAIRDTRLPTRDLNGTVLESGRLAQKQNAP